MSCTGRIRVRVERSDDRKVRFLMAVGMRRPAKELALRLVGRKVAKRLGYEDEMAMGDTAIRLYDKGSCRDLDDWKDVAARIEQLLEQAVEDGSRGFRGLASAPVPG